MTDGFGELDGQADERVWSLIELLAEHQGRDESPDGRSKLLDHPEFDHGRLVEQAMRQGLLAALGDFVTRHGLSKQLPPRLRQPVEMYLRLARHRAKVFTAEAARIAEGLAEFGITVAFTKGIVLQSTLYGNSGVRTYDDIDLMVYPDDTDRIHEALVALGFESEKVYDSGSNALTAMSRADAIMYRLSPDHLPHFHRLVDDICVADIAVDVASSLTWHGSTWQVPMDLAMADLTPATVLDDVILPTLSPVYSFLFLCLHLFREGWIERTIKAKDVSLAQFADIARQWQRSSPEVQSHIETVIKALGLERPIAWPCGHTDALFGTRIVEVLGLTEYASPEWLATAQGAGERKLRWSGDMRRRLRAPRPPNLVAAE